MSETNSDLAGIYMDYQASTPADPRVVEAMRPYWSTIFGNPHSTDHGFGWTADAAVEKARGQIAALIGADPDEIIFTSGATEANNLAILGIARASPRRRIVVSAIEHKSILAAARAAQDELGFEVVSVPVGANGIVDPADVAALLDERVALVSIMAVNNEIGTVQPLREIAATCQAIGAVFHSDAAQAVSVLPLDVYCDGADLMSMSAHKAYGPKGLGALYIRRHLPVRPKPIIHGGGQEQGLRSGTLPTPLCVGFGEACRILAEERDAEIERIAALRSQLICKLQSAVPGLMLNGALAPRHSGSLNVRFPGVDAELLLQALQPNVAASTGSACTSGQPEPSHVLRAIGLSAPEAASSIRFSIGRFTTREEIDRAVGHVAHALSALKDLGR